MRTNTVAKGFTLVEILIVVVILGILAAIVVPQFTNAANESRVGNVATQVSTIETQLELFRARNGTYPDLAGDEDWEFLVAEGYFKAVPRNPFSNSSNVAAFTAWPTSGDDGPADTTVAVIYGEYGSDDGWLYDVSTGNIAAAAPSSADPSATD